MPSPVFQLSVNGGATWLPADTAIAGSNALPLAFGGGIAFAKARLISQSDVSDVAWTITAQTAGASPLSLTTNGDKSVSFTVPTEAAAAYLLRATVNGGVDPKTGKATKELVRSLSIKVLTAASGELLAPGEEDESDRQEGWVRSYNALVNRDNALPVPWVATVDGWLNLRLGAPNTADFVGRDALIHAQPCTSGYGGGLYLGAGGGASAGLQESVYLGYVSTAGGFVASLRSRAEYFELYREDESPLYRVSRPSDRVEITTRSIGDAETQDHIIEYGATRASVIGDNRYTYFRWLERFTDIDLTAFSYHRTEGFYLNGPLAVGSATGVAGQRSITAEPITTSVTSPSAVVWSFPIPTNWSIDVVARAVGDNGTTSDVVVYEATFRRGAGSATTSHAAAPAGLTAFNAAPAHAMTIALNGNTIEVRLLPGSATSTKWSVTVGVQERSIA